MPSIVGIIPARLGSTRLPGKVLLSQTGKPLIQHVYESARRAARLSRLVIATDNDLVRAAAQAFGAECVLTSADHPNGTSRLREAAALLGLRPTDVIVNVQGDEPEIEPDAIDACVRALSADNHASIGTVAVPFAPGDNPSDPAAVKVVLDTQGRALYFSRSLIPHIRGDARPTGAAYAFLRHVGLYSYTRAFLDEYALMPPTPLEQVEQLEQLRALENRRAIAVAVLPTAGPGGIDTLEQYHAFVARVGAARA